jgi:hypothetical protein
VTTKTYQRHAFVLRIWQEEGIPWRGWVQHAGSQEQLYLQSLEELVAFLHDHTAGLLEPHDVGRPEEG